MRKKLILAYCADTTKLINCTSGPLSIPIINCVEIIIPNVITPNSPLVLRNIYLQIPENKITAIVGGSGSGKSTLLKLLVRLYKPSHGEIKMDKMLNLSDTTNFPQTRIINLFII